MDIILLLITFIPFMLIIWMANLAQRQREAGQDSEIVAGLSYGFLVALYLALILIGLGLYLIGGLLQGQAATSTVPGVVPGMEDVAVLLPTLPRIGFALWFPSLVGIILLVPALRRQAAPIIAIDPASPVHAIALSFIALVLMNLMTTLAVGLGNVADMLESAGGQPSSTSVAVLWGQNLLFVVLAMVGVGWLSRRSLRQAVQRLGIAVPSWRQVALGLGAGAVMAVFAVVVVMLSDRQGWTNEEVEHLNEILSKGLTESWMGVATLGLAAGIGEETLFRGALQPCFGVGLTTITFALMHIQYGFSLATVLIIVLSVVLGVIRLRTNTTTAMITHAAYNIGVVLISLLG